MAKKRDTQTSDRGRRKGSKNGALSVVGIGPGGLEHMTFVAAETLKNADVVVGYTTYMDLIRPLIKGKETFETGMTGEIERCQKALDIATTGKKVAVISSGDPGIYGMAGLVLELKAKARDCPVEVSIIPGVPAFSAAAAILGAPVMHDFAAISLSDILTPWETIKTRLKAAADADFVIAVYNPRSKSRVTQLPEAIDIISKSRPLTTPVGIVKDATRPDERAVVTTLGDIKKLFETIDMTTVIIVGNKSTFAHDDKIITPRGYEAKSRRKAKA